MSPGAKFLFEAWPYVAAFVLGIFIPSRKNWYERISIGIVGMLSVALVIGLWPGAEAARPVAGEEAAAPPTEWQNLLNVIVFLPIFGSIAILFLPRQSPALLRRFTMLVLGLDFLASLWLLKVPMTAGWHFQYVREWLPTFGIRYHVAVDGVSVWLILLSTLTTPIAAYVSFGSLKARTKDLCFALLLLHGGMLGAFVSLDLFLFYVFWELMLIPMVILIGVWGGVEKIKAAYKFFLYTMAGSVLMLAAILYMVWVHAKIGGFVTFDYLALKNLVLPKTAAMLCFWAFFLAFAVKVPMFPFHTWLPDAHVQAPTGGSIILAAVLLKLGTYGYIRFCMGMFAGPAWLSAANLAGIAIGGGILYAALVAWKQDDVKRLVAYSSVAHMGFVMLGLFSGTRSGVEGAVLQMINHGISTGALFLLVGVIYDRRHTREVREFGGLAKVMPIYAALFIIVTMSSIGVPGTNGFVGELMIVLGTFVSLPLGSHGQIQATLAMTGVILAAVYMLSVVQKMFFGPLSNPKNKNLPDMNVRETVAIAPLIALIFVIGLFPGVILDRMKDGVGSVLDGYTAGKKAYDELGPEATQPILRARKGGPLETGYPEPPKPEGATDDAPAEKTAELGAPPPDVAPVVVRPVQPGGAVPPMPAPGPAPGGARPTSAQPGHEGHNHP